jgi:hypothetical protein
MAKTEFDVTAETRRQKTTWKQPPIALWVGIRADGLAVATPAKATPLPVLQHVLAELAAAQLNEYDTKLRDLAMFVKAACGDELNATVQAVKRKLAGLFPFLLKEGAL